MDISIKQMVLEKMYAIYDKVIGDEDFACSTHCPHCCTRNVTMTTLEGYYILNKMDASIRIKLLESIQQQSRQKHFIPKVTINRMADLCARDRELPQEENDDNWGPCPVLDKQLCPLYLFRPFACRCMASRQSCKAAGYADLPGWVISVNTVIQQYIEHIDAKGFSGNFTDIMNFLANPQNYDAYAQDRPMDCPEPLLANQPVYVLMVPPEDRTRIAPLLDAIHKIKIDRVSG